MTASAPLTEAQKPSHMADFRSIAPSGGLSLQVALDTKLLGAWIDVNRFNPYQDLVGFFGHLFYEIIPHVFR